MEWKVGKALNPDVERQQLNKVLAEIQAAITKMPTVTTTKSTPVTNTVTRYAVARFTLNLVGDVTGSTLVDGTDDVTLTTTLGDVEGFVEEAPIDSRYYWRRNGEWKAVPIDIAFKPEGYGFVVQVPGDEETTTTTIRELEVEVGELTLDDGDGQSGNPTFGLADVADSGTGTGGVKLITRDSKGRITGTENADTGDLPEGSNLYFTDERAQDALAAAFAAGTHTNFTVTYNDVTNSFDFAASGGGGGASVIDSIADGDTTNAPSRNAVFDALALKLDVTTAASTYQPLDSDLTAVAGLSPTNDDILQRKAGAWTNRSMAQLKVDLSLSGTNTGDQTSIVGITGTKAEFDAACTDGNFAYQSDLSSYLTTAAAAAAYQPLDTQLTSLAGLTYASNALKVVRINAGETGFEVATVSAGSGDVVGPASAVNNRVVFFDGTTGKLIKDSGLTLSGSNTGDQTITLTGDVTGTGTGSFAATIANDAVTYAKIQNVSAASKLIGRGSASGSGDAEEITLGTNLSMSGTTLNASGMVLVGSNTVAGSAASTLAVSGLDLSTHGHYFLEFALKNATASASDVSFYYSGDTTASNYYRQSFNMSGGSTSGSRANNGVAAGMPASQTLTGYAELRLDIDGKARLIAHNNQDAVSALVYQVFNQARNTVGNVTSITLSASVANSLAVGSYLKVWRF